MESISLNTPIGDMKAKMTPELKGAVLSLAAHPGWIQYRAMIKSYATQTLMSLRTEKKDEYAKLIGRADGLFLAVDFLDLVVSEINRKEQARLVAAESKKQSGPHR